MQAIRSFTLLSFSVLVSLPPFSMPVAAEQESARLLSIPVEESGYADGLIFAFGEIDDESVIPNSIDVYDGKVWVGSTAGLLVRDATGTRWHRIDGPGIVDKVIAGDKAVAVTTLKRDAKYHLPGPAYWFHPEVGRWQEMPITFDSGAWQGAKFWFGNTGQFGFVEPETERMHVYDGSNLAFLPGKPIYGMEVKGKFVWMAMGDTANDENPQFPNGAIAHFNTESGRFEPRHRYHGAYHDPAYALAIGEAVTWIAHWSRRSDEQLAGITHYQPANEKWDLLPNLSDQSFIKARDLALAGNYLWFIDADAGLMRMHVESRRIEAHSSRAALPANLVDIAAGENGVWVAAYSYGAQGKRQDGVVAFIPNPPQWQTYLFEQSRELLWYALIGFGIALVLSLVARRFGASLWLMLLVIVLVISASVAVGLLWPRGKSGTRIMEQPPVQVQARKRLEEDTVATGKLREKMSVPDEPEFDIRAVEVIDETDEEIRLEVAYTSTLSSEENIYIGGDGLIDSRRLHLSCNPDPAPRGEGVLMIKIVRPDRLPRQFCTNHLMLHVYTPKRSVDIGVYRHEKKWRKPGTSLVDQMMGDISGCDVNEQ